MININKLYNIIFNKFSLALLVIALSTNAVSEVFQLGDVAPRGAPDGQLNAADSLILQRMILGEIIPTDDEKLIGDVAPLNSPDGKLDAGDLVVQQRAIVGLETLGTVDNNAFTFTPVLNSAVLPINQNPYQIRGTAQPNTSIEIYVNNVLQAKTLVVNDGSFRSYVTLDGNIANDIYVIAWDGSIYSNQSNHLNLSFGLTAPTLTNVSGSTTFETYTVSGQADSGVAVQIYNNGSLVSTASTDISGNFTSNITLMDGINTILAVATNGTTTSTPSVTISIEYHTNSIIPALNPGTSPTNSNPYTIRGKALPNEQVNIYVNGALQTLITSNASGVFTTTVTLVSGSNDITASARSGANETSLSTPITIVYDATFTTTPISGAQSGTPFTSGVIYEVTADITVANGQTLNIPAGTVLRFAPGAKLIVYGGLNILGTNSNPVILTTSNDSAKAGGWGGIYAFSTASSEAVLNIQNAVIEYASIGIEGHGNTTGTITNSTLRYN
ncbi:MAG TPA: hypothetical protein ENJ28_05850, partial [Gammaproteobacteria bacterium]|nr:hypothetical protein [Gammaproteobacteria bacterium]